MTPPRTLNLRRHASALLAALTISVATSCSAPTADTGRTPQSDSAQSVAASSAHAAPADTATLSFAFVGDVMMGTTFPDSINGSHLPPDGGTHLFDDARQIISRVDVAGGNLEGSFLEGPGRRRPMGNPKTYFIFRMPPAYVANLTDAGFDFMGIANNHINDFGAPGRSSTMQTLRQAGLPPVGLKDSCESAVFERKGLKIGVTQFGHGANNLDVTNLGELERVVKSLRRQCDIVIVAFHGGAEGTAHTHVTGKNETYVGENRGNVRQFARKAVDLGADIVYGHGPHVPRGAELYNDRIILYSLGNFCTPYRMGISGITGYAPIAELRIDRHGRFIDGQIHSLIQHRGKGPRLDPANSAARLMKTLSAADFPESQLIITDSGSLRSGKVLRNQP